MNTGVGSHSLLQGILDETWISLHCRQILCHLSHEKNDTVGWHHQLNEYEFEQTLGDSKGQEAVGSQIAGHDLMTKQQH